MKEKLYQTKQREIVLRFLAAHPHDAYDADGLYTALSQTGEKISRTTVYRVLKLLTETHRAVSFMDSDQKRTLFQYHAAHDATNSQIQLVCTGCGKTERLDCGYLSSFEAHLRAEHHFNINPTERVFSGLCGDCDAGAGIERILSYDEV